VSEVRTVAEGTGEETLVLVDEAYGEFTDSPSARELLDEREDVAILRTFSKAYGLAGMRLGYGLVPMEWADTYDRVNTPFAVGTLACHAGLAALEDEAHVEQTVETVQWARGYMHDHLDARTWESGGNFVLAEIGDAEAVAGASQEAGVIIRDCSSFGLSDCVRITCGTRETTRTAVETVNGVLSG
jgi:histidinol-phosphate aminotransferase